MTRTLLVGDVGGTNARFAFAEQTESAIVISEFDKLSGDAFPEFSDALASYLSQHSRRSAQACFALAGPVMKGEVQLTNRNWHVSERHLESAFGLSRVRLINDFRAMARAVPELSDAQFEAIAAGEAQPDYPIVVAGPGTGFGVATLFKAENGTWQVLNGEGGHAAYAPRSELEYQLAACLQRSHGYVSNELVASGSGLPAVHSAFCEIYARPYSERTPQDMIEAALAGDEMFGALVETRAFAVMSFVGDLVLANGALGGVVLAGGVTERIAAFVKTPAAEARFRERGPMSRYLAHVPVKLMRDPHAPLIGAAAHFFQLAS